MHARRWSGYLKESDHLEELRVDGRHNGKMECEGVQWINLAQAWKHEDNFYFKFSVSNYVKLAISTQSAL
jgi:hypothetical protein